MDRRSVIRKHLKSVIEQSGLSRYSILDILKVIDIGKSELRKNELKQILKEILISDYPLDAPIYIGMVK